MDLKSIEAAKRQVGGVFKLSVLLQKRIIELVRGAPPVINDPHKERSPIEVALREILEGKITLDMIPAEEFDALVEQARLDREGRVSETPLSAAMGAPPSRSSSGIPTIDIASDVPSGSSP